MAFKNSMPRAWWILALLVLGTLLAFLPVVSHPFTNLDDAQYVWNNQHVNQGLRWEGLAWASHTGYMGNWHPVTWTSHMLDVQLFGLRPGWHHLTNLLLHVANVVLLFVVMRRAVQIGGRRTSNLEPGTLNLEAGVGEDEHRTSNIEHPTSNTRVLELCCAVVAGLFALHPLRVESVAWVAERKDVLSGFFFLLTLWAYIRYAECGVRSVELARQDTQYALRNPPDVSRFAFHATLFYLLALTFFTLGLMSKGMLVTVPFVLLLVDYWPLGRISLKSGTRSNSGVQGPTPEVSSEANAQHPTRNTQHASRFTFQAFRSTLLPLLLEKVPFLLLTVAASFATFVTQQHYGAVKSLEALSGSSRLCNVLVAYAAYLGQVFWPSDLAVFYPLPNAIALASTVGAAILLAGLTAWAVASIRRRPHVFVGWFWFVGMLVPVIGLVQIGHQQRADRYTYLPLIGLLVMVVWQVSSRWAALKLKPAMLGFAAAAILALCFALTRLQVSYWANDERLFRHAVEVTQGNWFARQLLGRAVLFQGKPDEAILHYQAAAAIHPSPELRRVLGEALSWRGRLDEAAEQFSEVLKQEPDDVPVLVYLGGVRARQGRLDEAELILVRALRLAPGNATVHNAFGALLAQQGKHEHAAAQFEEALKLAPGYAEAHNNLAMSCAALKRPGDAISHYREALRLQPDLLTARTNLDCLLSGQQPASPVHFSDGLPAPHGGSMAP